MSLDAVGMAGIPVSYEGVAEHAFLRHTRAYVGEANAMAKLAGEMPETETFRGADIASDLPSGYMSVGVFTCTPKPAIAMSCESASPRPATTKIWSEGREGTVGIDARQPAGNVGFGED